MKNGMKRLLCMLLAMTMLFALAACEQDEKTKETTASTEAQTQTEAETEATIPVETTPQPIPEETAEAATEETTEEAVETEPVAEPKMPEDPAKALVGTWGASVNFSQYMCDMLALDLDVHVYEESLAFDMILTFNEDGTCAMELDASKIEEGFEALFDKVWDAIVEMAAEEAGISPALVKVVLRTQGVTKESLFAEFSAEEFFGDTDESLTGVWSLEGDQLTIQSDQATESAEPVTIEFIHENEFHIIATSSDEDADLPFTMLPLVFLRK